MSDLINIPMFPLSIFPLPGEMVPLHIFEPRYRQLLEDAESRDISFGIFFSHKTNVDKLGSLVRLESVIKRYKTGESDIIVKCLDIFTLNKLYRTYKDKLYPGGQVNYWKIDFAQPMGGSLKEIFNEYHGFLKLHVNEQPVSCYDVANELNLGFDERMRFINLSDDKKESYLISHIKYQIQLLQHAEKSKDVFHLN
jgi:hypothetical protein